MPDDLLSVHLGSQISKIKALEISLGVYIHSEIHRTMKMFSRESLQESPLFYFYFTE